MGIARQILLVDKVPADIGNIARYDMNEDCVITKSHDGNLVAEKKLKKSYVQVVCQQ